MGEVSSRRTQRETSKEREFANLSVIYNKPLYLLSNSCTQWNIFLVILSLWRATTTVVYFQTGVHFAHHSTRHATRTLLTNGWLVEKLWGLLFAAGTTCVASTSRHLLSIDIAGGSETNPAVYGAAAPSIGSQFTARETIQRPRGIRPPTHPGIVLELQQQQL